MSEKLDLIDLLIFHEGYRKYAYEDSVGVISCGVGRNLDSVGLSHDEIMYLLQNDLIRCYAELTNAFDWFPGLSEIRQQAMVNLCFNLGLTRLMRFKNALRSMEEGNYDEAARHFLDSTWARQVGERSSDIATMIRDDKYPKRFKEQRKTILH
jgi:lysozyme